MNAIANFVAQKTVSSGTGALLLAAVAGCRSFADAFGTGGSDVFFYFIRHRSAGEWEVGTGHMSDAQTLVRDNALASSSGGAKVNFSAGEKDIVNDIPAARQLVLPADATSGDVLSYSGDAWQAAALGIAQVSGLSSALAGKAAAAHTHGSEDIAGLAAALAAKAAATHGHTPADISGLEDALAGKADSAHGHDMDDISGLAAALAAKADNAHTHSSADIGGLSLILEDYAPAAHTHGTADIDGLTAALAAKAAAAHTHEISAISGLGDALDSRAPLSHAHAITDVTGLESALDAKAATSRSIGAAGSLSGGGDLSADRSFALSGDETSPGADKYYGTNGAGAKGFHPLPTPPEVDAPDAAEIDFDDAVCVHAAGDNVAAAIGTLDAALLRAGFHPRHSVTFNHFNGVEAGGFTPVTSGTNANAATLEADATLNTDAVGVCRLSTGTTASGCALRGLGTAAMMLHAPGKKLRLLSRIRLANLTASGSQEIRVWGGVTIGTAANTAPATAIGFYWYYDKDSANWVLRRRNTSALSDVDTGIAVEAGVWYDMELSVQGASADGDVTAALSINGVPCAVHSQLISPMLYNPVSAAIQKAAGTTARYLYLDYEALFVERA